MAFLAVLREGFETAVFLLATFNARAATRYGGIGALLGIVVAAVVGYGIYSGGLRINLSRFFRTTGVVLIVVAAGLVATALMTANEGGWIDPDRQAFDLSWLVRPGTPTCGRADRRAGHPALPDLAHGHRLAGLHRPHGVVVLWPTRRRKAPAAPRAAEPAKAELTPGKPADPTSRARAPVRPAPRRTAVRTVSVPPCPYPPSPSAAVRRAAPTKEPP